MVHRLLTLILALTMPFLIFQKLFQEHYQSVKLLTDILSVLIWVPGGVLLFFSQT